MLRGSLACDDTAKQRQSAHPRRLPEQLLTHHLSLPSVSPSRKPKMAAVGTAMIMSLLYPHYVLPSITEIP
jgi:hypothetical protein